LKETSSRRVAFTLVERKGLGWIEGMEGGDISKWTGGERKGDGSTAKEGTNNEL